MGIFSGLRSLVEASGISVQIGPSPAIEFSPAFVDDWAFIVNLLVEERKTVIIDYSQVEPEAAQRLQDFLMGAVFGKDLDFKIIQTADGDFYGYGDLDAIEMWESAKTWPENIVPFPSHNRA